MHYFTKETGMEWDELPNPSLMGKLTDKDIVKAQVKNLAERVRNAKRYASYARIHKAIKGFHPAFKSREEEELELLAIGQ